MPSTKKVTTKPKKTPTKKNSNKKDVDIAVPAVILGDSATISVPAPEDFASKMSSGKVAISSENTDDFRSLSPKRSPLRRNDVDPPSPVPSDDDETPDPLENHVTSAKKSTTDVVGGSTVISKTPVASSRVPSVSIASSKSLSKAETKKPETTDVSSTTSSKVSPKTETSRVSSKTETSKVPPKTETSKVSPKTETPKVSSKAETSKVSSKTETSKVPPKAEPSKVSPKTEVSQLIIVSTGTPSKAETQTKQDMKKILEEAESEDCDDNRDDDHDGNGDGNCDEDRDEDCSCDDTSDDESDCGCEEKGDETSEDSDDEEDINIESLLDSLFFDIRKKIINNDKNYVKYVEALTPLGQTVYIDLNDRGTIMINEGQDVILKNGQINSIDHSMKNGVLKCVDNICSGVAIVCEDGICVVKQKGIENPKEATYVYSKKADGPEHMTPYPIILFKELKANPNAYIDNVNKATSHLRDTEYKRCLDTMDKTGTNLENLVKAYGTYSTKQRKIYKTKLGIEIEGLQKPLIGIQALSKYFNHLNFDQKKASASLKRSIKKLEEIFHEYETYPVSNDGERKSFLNVIYNLEKRNELTIGLINLCSCYTKLFEESSDYLCILEDTRNNDLLETITGLNQMINTWGNKIVGDIQIIEKRFSDLDKVFLRS